MKKILYFAAIAVLSLCATSCYEDFIKDYEFSATYFASQKPLRTVIAGRDMGIEIATVVGGKRDGWKNDYATISIDESLLAGTSLTLLPEEYYTLSDTTLVCDKPNIPLLKAKMKFTDAFYADAGCLATKYALPVKIVKTSLDSVLTGMDYSVIAIKFISSLQGTYYAKGSYSELDGAGVPVDTVTYANSDLNSNITRSVTSTGVSSINVSGLGSASAPFKSDVIGISVDGETVTVTPVTAGRTVSDFTGSCTTVDGRLQIQMSFKYNAAGKDYLINETLIRRADPYDELFFEEW